MLKSIKAKVKTLANSVKKDTNLQHAIGYGYSLAGGLIAYNKSKNAIQRIASMYIIGSCAAGVISALEKRSNEKKAIASGIDFEMTLCSAYEKDKDEPGENLGKESNFLESLNFLTAMSYIKDIQCVGKNGNDKMVRVMISDGYIATNSQELNDYLRNKKGMFEGIITTDNPTMNSIREFKTK